MPPIYLDYNATTPVDPAVAEAIWPYLTEHFGNPSSAHAYGRKTHDAIETARAQAAALLGARPQEIIFTGGGTEASNQALCGAYFAGSARRFVTCAVEHPATLKPLAFLQNLGAEVIIVPVDGMGRVDPDEVARHLGEGPTLVSIMHANNEVGTIQPIREIAAHCKKAGALLHTDAAQSLGKIPVNVEDLGVDLLTVAGHKVYAPKGVGLLYTRAGVKVDPFIRGAGHESGRRAGTENVPYLVGLGVACELAGRSLAHAEPKLRALRDRLWETLHDRLGSNIVLHGHPEQRLPNTLNVSFVGHVGAELLAKAPDIAASTGSACHAGEVTLSPVLKAMGVDPHIGMGAVRLSVGRYTTASEIDIASQLLAAAAAMGRS